VRPSLRIANCSGFYGDRLSAAQEMVDGGPIDVLTGDWLAELTMLVLAKNMLRDPTAGYARTFVTQMEQVMGACLDRGIKVVSNAGGLAPQRCADAVAAVAGTLGLDPVIAYIEGDDLMPRLAELRAAGTQFANSDTGEALGERPVLTANAYLGGWGIADALGRGADIVITGRVTDAALTAGPAAWHHGWRRDDWDALAGAIVAGHVIECGAQATGGNFAFFTEVPGLEHPGFPIAEVAGDGSSVITKHPGQGGMVSVDTVTAQLLYEIGGPAYLNPDVTARFDSIRLSADGPDRVRISGVRGDSPPETAKVAVNYYGGWRSTLTLYLTGLDIEAKAALVEQALWAAIPGGRGAFDAVEVSLLRTDKPDPPTNAEAMAQLRITVKDADERKAGRAFSARVTELALASYPGMFGSGLTGGAQAFGVYWPTTVAGQAVKQEVVIGEKRNVVGPVLPPDPPVVADVPVAAAAAAPAGGATVRVPLGWVVGARSGDKGGNANLGVWARSDAAYAWLAGFLTVAKLKELLPETAPLPVERYDLANLRALNFVIVGLLGEGVAASSRLDPQAKSLGEWLRARLVDIPAGLLPVRGNDDHGEMAAETTNLP
jgi:Acyclic terpene utilisation family protein AtuA